MIFRYPGGKGKIAAKIVEKIREVNGGTLPNNYIEPFAGGASVALQIAQQNPATTIWLNDSDWWVTSFWEILCDSSGVMLDALLAYFSTPIDIQTFWERRAEHNPDVWPRSRMIDYVESAYNAVFFNRTTYSGILSSGPIGGASQTGKYKVNCRWNAARLTDEIKQAHALLFGRSSASCRDWTELFSDLDGTDWFFYLDPPYYKKGAALYPQRWTHADHESLRDYLAAFPGKWLLSYDACPEVRELYAGDQFQIESFEHFRSMGNHGDTHTRKPRPRDASELFIYPK